MSAIEIANILYNMSLGMGDYVESLYKDEIEIIARQINRLRIEDNPLFYILENIAEDYTNMFDLAVKQNSEVSE